MNGDTSYDSVPRAQTTSFVPSYSDSPPVAIASSELAVSEQLQLMKERLRQAEERACHAESELERIREVVALAATRARQARNQRRILLAEAQELAKQIVGQAQAEADLNRSGDSAMSMTSWASVDPTLDKRVDSFLKNEMEPDSTRGWMLNDA